MNGSNLLLDTNIVLYLLNGEETLIPLLEEKILIVSFITELELLSYKKIQNNYLEMIKEFLSECQIIDINPAIKGHAINIRKNYPLKLPDAIIAATSLYLNTSLISADKQFSKVEFLDLILYQK